MERFYLGVDVGTGSARAGVFDRRGRMHGEGGEHPIRMWRPEEGFAEHSSQDIWEACGHAVRAALAQAALEPARIRGVGFDATCSLVVLGPKDEPVTVSVEGDDRRNVIVWMDHRAVEQAERINATGHDVLRYVGGVISPEMESPKLLWLEERLPESWRRAARFLDLPDFLCYRATGVDVRSLCTTTCKWGYLGHAEGWSTGFFERIGLTELAAEGFARIGTRVRPLGERAGTLTERAAAELGLAPGTAVSVSIIDAHAGGLGLLGAPVDGRAPGPAALDQRLALIGGTSSCHMAVSKEPRFIDGVWGPYYSAMVPGFWLTEGGQSATGALIDHVVFSHARAAGLSQDAAARKTTVYALLNDRLDALARGRPFPAALTEEIHVLPYFHGNRSPRADPLLRGMVSGLKLSDSVDQLALAYLATVQAIACGTRHILETLNRGGFRIDTLLACGGDTKNPAFLREHADVTGCRIVLPQEPEAVLLGSAILGAVACGDHDSVLGAMGAMSAAGRVVEPAGGEVSAYHDRKHRVFLAMYEDQRAYAETMRDPACWDADRAGPAGLSRPCSG